MAEPAKELLGSADLADRFGWSIAGIAKLDRLGVLPAARRIAGRRYWDSSELPVIEQRLQARRNERRQDGGKAA